MSGYEPGDVIGLVLSKLDGVRQRGGYWMARCPVPDHQDRKASLSVARGTEQPVVFKCHAGCERDAILDAAGLTLADVSKPLDESREEWTPRGPATAVYDYTDERGKLLFQVCRTAGKQFPQRRPDPSAKSGWAWNLKGVQRVPYRLPQILRAARGKVADRVAWIAEGEKDVHALEVAGVVATCNPGGAGKWRDEYGRHFAGFREVVIVADKDEAGRKHAAQVAASVSSYVTAVTIVEAAQGKDAADHLAAGLSLADFRAAGSDVSDSCQDDTGTLTMHSDSPDTSDTGSDDELLAGVRDGAWLSVQQFPPLRFAVPGLIPEGFTLQIGPPKVGKSWLMLDLLLAVASGGLALGRIDAGAPRRVLYLALEDSDRRMQDRCRALLRPGEEIPALFSYQTRVEAGMVLDTIAAWMRRHTDTALVVIDTLGKVMPPAGQGESAYQRDYRIGSAVKAQADAHPGLAIVVTHHDRKASADDFIDSVSGTHGLAGAADTITLLARRRQSDAGTLKIVGRDVAEDEYALTFTDGKAWQLDGAGLGEAAATARRREESRSLGDTSAQIIDFVSQQPGGVYARDVVAKFGKDAYQYLKRLTAAGRIDKAGRGLYIVSFTPASEPSEVSETQVTPPIGSDSESDSVRNDDALWPEGTHGAEAREQP